MKQQIKALATALVATATTTALFLAPQATEVVYLAGRNGQP